MKVIFNVMARLIVMVRVRARVWVSLVRFFSCFITSVTNIQQSVLGISLWNSKNNSFIFENSACGSASALTICVGRPSCSARACAPLQQALAGGLTCSSSEALASPT